MTDGPREVVFLDDGPEPGPAEELPAPAPGSRRSRVAVLAGAALVIAGGVALARSTGGSRGPSPASPAASASAPRLGVTPAARPIPLPTHVNGTLNEAQDDSPSLQLVHLPLCPAAPCVVQTDVPASVRRHVLRALPGARLGPGFSVYRHGRLVSRELLGHVGRSALVIDVVQLRETQGPTIEASVDEGAVRGTAEVTGYLVAAQLTPAGRALFLPVQHLLGDASAMVKP